MKQISTPTTTRRTSVMPVSGGGFRTPARSANIAPTANAASTYRRSSFFNKPYVAKDPRPLNQLEFKAEMIRKVHRFLVDECGMTDISERVVRSPSSRDFITIFECIYQHLDANYKIKGKIEEEVPKLFVNLGYPYPLKGSSLQTVGAAHAWPQVLGALVWLVDIVKLSSAITPQDIIIGSTSAGETTEATLGYLFKQNVYSSALQGSAMDDAFMKNHMNRLRVQLREGLLQGSQVKEIKEQVELLQEEIKILRDEGDADHESQLKADLVTLQSDLRAQRNYLGEIQMQKAACVQHLEEIKNDVASTEDTLSKLQRRILESEERIHRQTTEFGLEPEAARKIKGENSTLRAEIHKLRTELEEISQKKWKERPVLGDNLYELKNILRQWYREVLEIKMAINGNDIAHIEEETPDPTTVQELYTTITDECPKLLNEVRKLSDNAIRSGRTQFKLMTQEIAAKSRELKTLQERIANQSKNTAMEERQRARTREQWEHARKVLELDAEKLQQKLEVLADKKTELSRLDADIKQLQFIKQKQTAALIEREQGLNDLVLDQLAKIAKISEQCLSVNGGMDSQLDELEKEMAAYLTENKPLYDAIEDKENERNESLTHERSRNK